jgi:uncharacterized membrane protein
MGGSLLDWRAMRLARFFAGPVMVAAGINHFVNPRFYKAIMPDYLPAHDELVAASGVAEIVGAAGTMIPATRKPAGWFLIATLVAVFPANVHMALHPERYKKVPGGPPALYARLPVQALFIYWVYKAAIRSQ